MNGTRSSRKKRNRQPESACSAEDSQNRANGSSSRRRKTWRRWWKSLVASRWVILPVGFVLISTSYNLTRLVSYYGAELDYPTQSHGNVPGGDLPFQNSYFNALQSRATTPQPIHIYWINADEEKHKRRSMEEVSRVLKMGPQASASIDVQGLHTRIPRWTTDEVREVYQNPSSSHASNPRFIHKLIMHNNMTLVEKAVRAKRHLTGTFADATRWMSHLTAMEQALIDGHDRVLIFEDDVILTQDFFNHWEAYASLAPLNWTLLQWTTSNVPTIEQTFSIPEPWISWLPDLWGAHAYLVTRRGLQAMHKRVMLEPSSDSGTTGSSTGLSVVIDERLWGVSNADEMLFTLDQSAYSSTFPWVLTEAIRKSIDSRTNFGQRFSITPPNLPLPTMETVHRNESLLVFMNVRFATAQRMRMEMERVLADVEAVCKIHEQDKCQWIIHANFAKAFLKERFQQTYPSLPSNLHFRFSVSEGRFNKFELMKRNLHNMSQYDLVLLKDNDQSLAGFPWASFLQRKGDALVAGPLRQAPDESFSRSKIWDKRQHYKFHDAHAWKLQKFMPWSTKLFVEGAALEVPFLEMYFNVFDGPFAEWFFSSILTKNFTQQDSSWGPDYLWCPAAKAYEPNRAGCVLVPFVSVHEDTRQIVKDGEAFNDRGYLAVKHMRQSNRTFNLWHKTTEKYAQGVIAWRQLDAITKHCNTKLLKVSPSANLDFKACIDAGMARKTIAW